MPEPHIIRARPPRSAAVALLAAAELPISDLTDQHLEYFFFTGSEGLPTGLVGLEIYGTDALLRSLVVSADVRIDRSQAPPSIQSTREFAGLCPASADFMIKRLNER